MASLVRLLGNKLLNGPGTSVSTVEALRGASVVGLYFSASWCPPCRGFTPSLIESYEGKLKAKGMECVLISRDRDMDSFLGYYEKMPWFALPFESSIRNQMLGQRFGVRTIPSLALVDKYGRTITTGAREAVVQDAAGKNFPWRAPLVVDLKGGDPGRLNELPSLVLLCEEVGPAAQEASRQALMELAEDRDIRSEREAEAIEVAPFPEPETEEALEKALLGLDGGGDCGFFIATGGPLASKVRELCGLAAGGPPQLLLLDIPDNGGFYLGAEGDAALSGAAATELLTLYETKQLPRKQLRLS